MKKIIALFIIICIFAITAVFPASAAEVDIVNITFESTENGIVTSHPRGDSTDLSILIDKNISEDVTAHNETGIVLFQNTQSTTAGKHPSFSLIIELEKYANLSGAEISFYKEYNSMIGLPKDNEIIVEASEDGIDFNLIDSFIVEGEAVNGVIEVQTANIDLNGSGKFVKFTFSFGDSPFEDKPVWEWIGLTEINVFADDTVIETSDTSETSDISSDIDISEETSTTVPTGEVNVYMVFAFFALISFASALIIKKIR